MWECDPASFASAICNGGWLGVRGSSFASKANYDLRVFVDNPPGRWQANIINTGPLSVLLLRILQRTAAMQGPVEGVPEKAGVNCVLRRQIFVLV